MKTYPYPRVSVSSSDEVISCAECDALLEVYLDAELANVNVKYYYTKVWQHLQRCRCCATYHDWLYTVLSQGPAASPFLRSYRNPVRLSFLPFHQPQPMAAAATPAYHTYLRSALLGEPFLLRIAFSSTYLQEQCQRLIQVAYGTAVAAEYSPSPCLLLKQWIPMPEQDLLIKLIAYPLSARLGLVRLQATLSTTSFAATTLQVHLQWGKVNRVAKVTDTGKADLGPVPLIPLTTPEPARNPSEEKVFALTVESLS